MAQDSKIEWTKHTQKRPEISKTMRESGDRHEKHKNHNVTELYSDDMKVEGLVCINTDCNWIQLKKRK